MRPSTYDPPSTRPPEYVYSPDSAGRLLGGQLLFEHHGEQRRGITHRQLVDGGLRY